MENNPACKATWDEFKRELTSALDEISSGSNRYDCETLPGVKETIAVTKYDDTFPVGRMNQGLFVDYETCLITIRSPRETFLREYSLNADGSFSSGETVQQIIETIIEALIRLRT